MVGGITLALTLGLLEIGLRLFAPQISPEMRYEVLAGLFTNDAATGYRNAPGAQVRQHDSETDTTYDINAQGLREARLIGPPAPDTTRVLALGDSFAFGAGVDADQTYAHLLNGIPAGDGTPLDVVNGGVDGYGTDNEAAWLTAYGWAFQPRIVLLGFFVGNDTYDNFLGLHKTYVNADRELVESDPALRGAAAPEAETGTGLLGGPKLWLAQHSQAYVFLRGLAHAATALFVPSHIQPVTPRPFDTAPGYYKTEPPDLATGWTKTFAILDQMRADVAAHGARLVIVVIPAREQVEDAAWRQMQVRFGLSEADLERDHPQRRLAAWSTQTGTPLIDLLPGFQAAPPSPPLYFGYDIHWTAAGHALAAQLIRAGLARLGLAR